MLVGRLAALGGEEFAQKGEVTLILGAMGVALRPRKVFPQGRARGQPRGALEPGPATDQRELFRRFQRYTAPAPSNNSA